MFAGGKTTDQMKVYVPLETRSIASGASREKPDTQYKSKDESPFHMMLNEMNQVKHYLNMTIKEGQHTEMSNDDMSVVRVGAHDLISDTKSNMHQTIGGETQWKS